MKRNMKKRVAVCLGAILILAIGCGCWRICRYIRDNKRRYN